MASFQAPVTREAPAFLETKNSKLEPAQAKPQAGFTLIELLVVILIFSVFSLMAYGGLDSVLNTRRDVERALDRAAALQKAYMRLRNDLQQVRNRPARDGYGDTQPALRSDQNSRVEFTRGGWRNPTSQPRASLERVAWRLEDRKLLRDSWRVLDQAQDSKPVTLTVLEDVEELRWRFLDSGTQQQAQREWHTSWPPVGASTSTTTPAAIAGPPLAVEVTLATKDFGELTYLFRLGIEPVTLAASFTPGGVPPGDLPPTPCDPTMDDNCLPPPAP